MSTGVTGSWGKSLINQKSEKFNASITSFMTSEGFEATKAKTIYNEQFSLEQLNQVKEIEKKNIYSKFNKLSAANLSHLKYDSNYCNKVANIIDIDKKFSNDVDEKNAIEQLNRYNESGVKLNKRLYSKDAPIALGRSGARMERGKSSSGLIGEVFCSSDDPSINSFAQRTWLVGRDPALAYKVNGVPVAYMPNDVSLAIGDSNEVVTGIENDSFQAPKLYPRRAVLTGGPYSRAGAARAGVFMDEFEPKIEKFYKR